MKIMLKKIIFAMLILILLFSINSEVFGLSEIISDGDGFLGLGQSKIDKDSLQELSGYIYNTLLAAGVIIAVIVATVLGIQFMMGGAEGQAKVKEMILPFVVGCIIVFGGFGIWKVAITLGESIESTTVDVPSYEEEEEEEIEVMHCDYCGEQLDAREQRNRQCKDCGMNMK